MQYASLCALPPSSFCHLRLSPPSAKSVKLSCLGHRSLCPHLSDVTADTGRVTAGKEQLIAPGQTLLREMAQSDIIMAHGKAAQDRRRPLQGTQPGAHPCHVHKDHSFGNCIRACLCPGMQSPGAMQRKPAGLPGIYLAMLVLLSFGC